MEGSRFQGFAAQVHNINDVRRVYKHFKIKYARYSHVMMAYRLPGTNKAYDEDYYDHSEYGGGRRLYRILKNEELYSVMLLVARDMGPKMLGPDRFIYIMST